MATETPPVAPASGVGEAIAQALAVTEEYAKPFVTQFEEPGTGLKVPALIVQSGVQAVPESIFDEYREHPKRRRGTATLTDLDSFIEHVNRFKSDESAVFANDTRTDPSLTAVLDYHPAGAASAPDFGRHRSTFKFPLSDEWKAWHQSDKKAMGMRDFAEFLEDRIIDIEHPSDVSLTDEAMQGFIDKLGGIGRVATPTRLLELSTGLSINENSTIKEATKLQSGEGHLVFQTEHLDAATGMVVDIPSLFLLAIPVFKKGDYYRVVARLRYRVHQGNLSFWYELWRTDRVFDHAYGEARGKVKEQTSLPVLLGTPEA